jgi:transpeptidase family protein
MKKLALAGVVALAALLVPTHEMPAAGATGTSASSLYSQSAAQAIPRALAECETPPSSGDAFCSQRENLSYLLLDVRSGIVLASDWPGSESPIPLGSLVKPFTALAYGEKHNFKYPVHLCRGTASGCWRPRGHGRIGLESAIANSCNSYFRMLTHHLRAEDLQPIATMFALQMPDAGSSGASLAGIGAHWLISPLALARAYLELSRRSEQPGVGEILAGLAQSGRAGTGAEVDHVLRHSTALVKTGTAPCTHARRAPGDGFVIAMVPADHPEVLLMVRVHGTPGSHAAKVAGELLRWVE